MDRPHPLEISSAGGTALTIQSTLKPVSAAPGAIRRKKLA